MRNSPPNTQGSAPAPERMRQAVADYVAALHAAYLSQAGLLAPAAQGRLPLVRAADFCVAAVGARYLHVVATTELLGTARGREARVHARLEPLSWTVTFYDPTVLPALGLLDEDAGPALTEVRRLLGMRTYLYHLTMQPPAELAAHNAMHAGTALANSHAALAREFDLLRSVLTGDEGLVDELEGAMVAGLPRAQALLAQAIVPNDPEVAVLARDQQPESAALVRAIRRAVRRRRPLP
jgi:hypothetical protein